MNRAQRKLLTYLLVQYGQGLFNFYDYKRALLLVFPGGVVGKNYCISLSEFRHNHWLLDKAPAPNTLRGYTITDKAVKELCNGGQ